MKQKRVALAISGASGVVLGLKTLQALVRQQCRVDLVVSKDACHTAVYELSRCFRKPEAFIEALEPQERKRVQLYRPDDFSAPIASGSCRLDATLIVPCSMASLAAIANGLGDTLLRRLADVALKERWPLILMPREAPFSAIHLEHMLKLSRLGVTIMPPVPSWYVPLHTIEQVEEQLVGRLLQLIGLEDQQLLRPWQGQYQERIASTLQKQSEGG